MGGGSATGGGEGSGNGATSVFERPLIRHSVRLRSHSCHLPARSIATSPLWLKTVTRGLFLRCFAPPRRAPEGEGVKADSCFIPSFQRIREAFLVCPLVFNVISTGVRTTVRTQWRNPPRKRYNARVRFVRLPFREIATVASRHRRVGWREFAGGISFPRDCHASLAMTRR